MRVASSPEGTFEVNNRISRERAESIKVFLFNRFPDLTNAIDVTATPVAWAQLLELVRQDTKVPYQQEVLELLQKYVGTFHNKMSSEELRRSLMSLREGEPWRYMYRELFPATRYSNLVLITSIVEEVQPTPVPVEPEPVMEEPAEEQILPSLPPVEPIIEPEEKGFQIDVHSNLLCDALLTPNIGFKLPLGKGWAIGGNWMYGWWSRRPVHFFWRAYGGDAEVSYNWGRKESDALLSRHSVGVYGQLLYYDFELGGPGQLSEEWSWGTGLSYGYTLPIAERWSLQFGLGVGYLTGEYSNYRPWTCLTCDNPYVRTDRKLRHWFGPTKASISLVWHLGKGNSNASKRKGGAR